VHHFLAFAKQLDLRKAVETTDFTDEHGLPGKYNPVGIHAADGWI